MEQHKSAFDQSQFAARSAKSFGSTVKRVSLQQQSVPSPFTSGATRRSRPRRATPPLSRWHFQAIVLLTDMALIFSSAALSYWAIIGALPPRGHAILMGVLFMVLVAHCVMRAVGSYRFDVVRHGPVSLMRAIGGWLLGASPLLLLYAVHDSYDAPKRIWITTWLAAALALIAISRLALAYTSGALTRSGWLGYTIAIVGSGIEARSCGATTLASSSDVILLGYFADDGHFQSMGADVKHLGPLSDINAFLQGTRVDQLIVATPPREQEAVSSLVRELRCLPVHLAVWPESVMVPADWDAGTESGSCLPVLPVARMPLHGWRWIIKDAQDRFLALLLLLVCSPVLLAAAVGIKLSSPGPVFFRQVREGYCNGAFRIYKFRTMHVTAEAENKLKLTEKDDPRIFSFGSLLRKSSLDELPQLLNVLLGDMWLVGPRPHSPLATAAGRRYGEAVSRYAARHRVKPGITGWAQVNGLRGPTITAEQIEQRVAHDLFYIEHWSPRMDLYILFRTATGGFVHENAF